ncbi:Seipin-1 [Vitis vinifera]|uniref:Seipin-1 n=1 Tax=Vitis vinifera TaxID=29760 RepID=A0A438JEP5_VITVI|nr:Seipin-1 [Vitis vinifera]
MSINGDVIAKSSHPCMLRFRSLPVQLTRTFLMGVPLLLGISSETQELTIEILKHKEGYSRTKAIRVTLIPRAGTLSLPQIYEAELLMNSQLPWKKKTGAEPVLFPVTTASQRDHNERDLTMEVSKEPDSRARDAREASESLKRWQRSRNKRKVDVLQKLQPETVGSSASSITITREDTSAFVEEDVGDSESVC